MEASSTLSLVGRGTLPDTWKRHFLDSAQLFTLFEGDEAIADIGTGAGFPGMVLAMMGCGHVHLVENNQQKVAFLRKVAHATSTLVTIHNVKAEALPVLLPDLQIGCVTSRALAPLTNLLEMSSALFLNGARAVFPKGRNALSEVEAARQNWIFQLETRPSLTSVESSILCLSGIRRKT